jgi:hypothetical protein
MASFNSNFESPIVIEKDYESITIGWGITTFFNYPNRTKTNTIYELQMKEDDKEWISLSTSLSNNIIRKKNLSSLHQYSFRYRSSDDGITYVSWSNASIPTTVLDKTIKQMTPPTLLSKDANSITLKWDNNTVTTSNDGYRLRYRIDTDITWHNIDSIIKGSSVKKKGLLPGKSYYFSIKPNDDAYEWSCSSTKLTVAIYSNWMMANISSQLVSKNGLVTSSDAICGKVVAIYFSASWYHHHYHHHHHHHHHPNNTNNKVWTMSFFYPTTSIIT